MKVDKGDMCLYVVTDRTWVGERDFMKQMEAIIQAGATFIQLREKDLSFVEFVQIATEIKRLTDRYELPFVINDAVEVAIKVDADGVHIGQSDMALSDVRALIGPDKILGVSAQTVEQAQLAEKNGADYIGVGAMFTTKTKRDADSVSWETLKSICESVTIPVVAIGGIHADNLLKLKGTGVHGVAVVSAIFAQENVGEATGKLRMLSEELIL